MPITKVKGSNVCLFVGDIDKKVIAASTSCKIGISMATIKTSSKDSGDFEESIDGRFTWTMDSEQFMTTGTDTAKLSYDDILAMILAKELITVTIGQTTGVLPASLGTGKALKGTAWITKCDNDAKDGDAATYSISLEGSGELVNAVPGV